MSSTLSMYPSNRTSQCHTYQARTSWKPNASRAVFAWPLHQFVCTNSTITLTFVLCILSQTLWIVISTECHVLHTDHGLLASLKILTRFHLLRPFCSKSNRSGPSGHVQLSYPVLVARRQGQGRRLPPTPSKPSTLQLKQTNINFPKLNASPTHVSHAPLAK